MNARRQPHPMPPGCGLLASFDVKRSDPRDDVAALVVAQRAVAAAATRAPREGDPGHGDWHAFLGTALLERALLRWRLGQVDGTLDDLGLALEALHPRRHSALVVRCFDLLEHVAEGLDAHERLHRVARLLAAVRERAAYDGSCPACGRLLELDGRLFERLGVTHRAEHSLRQAHHVYRRLGAEQEMGRIGERLARLLAM